MNVAPFEVIMGPMTAYTAAVGTAFPATDEAPDSGDWTLVGTSGNRNYTEDGVSISMAQTLGIFRGLGSTLPIKTVRSEEDVMVSLVMADMALEQVALALNGNAVVDTAAGAGTVGYRSIALYRGPDVATMALLVRGASPYFASGYAQFEIPVCVVESSPEITYTKSGEPAAIEITWRLMADLTAADAAQAGYLRAMDAAAS